MTLHELAGDPGALARDGRELHLERRPARLAELLAHPGGEGVDPSVEVGVGGERGDDALDLLLVDGVEHGHAELLLAGEVGVHGALGESGRDGDLVERGTGVAVGEEELARDLDEPFTGLGLAFRARGAALAVDAHRCLPVTWSATLVTELGYR